MNKLEYEIHNYDKVTKLLLDFKFHPQMQGFEFLRSAVLYYLDKGDDLSGITTDVYPLLAEKYNTQVSSVERNIRKIIDKAYKFGGLLSINDYFDTILYTNKFKYSNYEIISILVEIIRLDNLKEELCGDDFED